MTDITYAQVWADHPIGVGEPGETVVVTVLSGDTVYYGDRTVTSSSNLGSLTVGQSVTVTPPQQWLRSASQSWVQIAGASSASGAVGVTTRSVSGATGLTANAAFVDTLVGTVSYAAPTGAVAGVLAEVDLNLVQDNTGSRTVSSWFGGITWLQGAAPVLPTAAGQSMLVTFISMDGGVTWLGSYQATGLQVGILAMKQYAPGSPAAYTAGTSSADVDATNLAVTFNYPASGKVLVTFNAFVVSTGNTTTYWWTLREASSDLQQCAILQAAFNARWTAHFYVSGTPGSQHTYKWGQFWSNAGTAPILQANGTASSSGPATMIVEAAV
jgi:hypothetical protein